MADDDEFRVDFDEHLSEQAERFGLVEQPLREAVRAELTRQVAAGIVAEILAGKVAPPETPEQTGGTSEVLV